MKTSELTDKLIESFDSREWLVAREVAVRGSNGRIDVVAIRQRQFLHKQLRAYEVKVSRSDFLADVGSQKWRKYLSVCHQVYFAAPAGLLRKEEIPGGAGLVVYGEKGWQTVKSAPISEPANLDADALLSIMFSMSRDRESKRDKLARLAAENRLNMSAITEHLGGEIGRRLAGVSPQAEKDAERIWREVTNLFSVRGKAPSSQDVIEILRFAALLRNEREAFRQIGDFLVSASRGYEKYDPKDIAKELEKLQALRKTKPLSKLFGDDLGNLDETKDRSDPEAK